jgi:NAD-dependent SIR2 family protein deacetylase
MKLATPGAFARNPDEVHAFYNMRRKNLLAADRTKHIERLPVSKKGCLGTGSYSW